MPRLRGGRGRAQRRLGPLGPKLLWREVSGGAARVGAAYASVRQRDGTPSPKALPPRPGKCPRSPPLSPPSAGTRMLQLVSRPLSCIRVAGRLPSRSLMDLRELVSALNNFASLSLAESWDNVGLLVEPSPPHTVKTLFLTNDLTEEVMEEAVQKKADLILSYHPPIFTPLKRVTWKTWKERLVVRALEHRIGIYSPHTAYDAIPHGVNNWLTKGLGEILLRTKYWFKLLISIHHVHRIILCRDLLILLSSGSCK